MVVIKLLNIYIAATPVCEQQKDAGYCHSDGRQRWYFDQEKQKCQAFTYSGCGGNANNFASEVLCMRHCGGNTGLRLYFKAFYGIIGFINNLCHFKAF